MAMMEKLVVKRVPIIVKHLNELIIEEQSIGFAVMQKLVVTRVPAVVDHLNELLIEE
jgi:hypothetical protein